MKRYGWFLVALLGCQRGDGANQPPERRSPDEPRFAEPRSAEPRSAEPRSPGARVDTPYARDIEKLCDVLVRSGGDQAEGADRNYLVATWLGSNLETPESRKFLARIQPLVGEPKASALEVEAKTVGLAHCALADEWRKLPSR
jgi:hypothetical protein